MTTPSRVLVLPRGTLPKLCRADPGMARLIRHVGKFRLERGTAGSHLGALVRSIVYQQLSGKAAATIHGRLVQLFEAESFPDPAAILTRSESELRGVGLSRQKIAAVRDLCAKATTGALPLEEIDRLDDEAVIEHLTQVRGIGVWSAQMFLMFHLGRLDVWPTGDLGIQKGVAKLYRMRRHPSRSRMEKVGDLFRPYRSVASWYLWRLVDDRGGTF